MFRLHFYFLPNSKQQILILVSINIFNHIHNIIQHILTLLNGQNGLHVLILVDQEELEPELNIVLIHQRVIGQTNVPVLIQQQKQILVQEVLVLPVVILEWEVMELGVIVLYHYLEHPHLKSGIENVQTDIAHQRFKKQKNAIILYLLQVIYFFSFES